MWLHLTLAPSESPSWLSLAGQGRNLARFAAYVCNSNAVLYLGSVSTNGSAARGSELAYAFPGEDVNYKLSWVPTDTKVSALVQLF